MKKILIIDIDKTARTQLKAHLIEEGYLVNDTETESAGIELLKESRYDVVISDLCTNQCGCVGIMKWISENAPATKVIIVTSYASVDCIVQTMKMGAFNYMLKPVSAAEIAQVIENALKLDEEFVCLKNVSLSSGFDDIIGVSDSIKQTIQTALKVAEIDSNILIMGESGTGKELVAEAIHNNSQNRKDFPYVAVNCAAIPDSILESELFGYVKGAFTGAGRDKKGLFEVADRGTIFMDEIGDTSAQFQSKLLRVIEAKEIRRVGDTQAKQVDVRIIAATNKDIAKMAAAGSFRADLFYRLSVVDINIAPLRERKEDIRPLIDFFLNESAKRLGKNITGVSEDAIRILYVYDWPGNVRELKNSIERAVALSEHSTLHAEDFPLAYDYFNRLGLDTEKREAESERDIVTLKEIETKHVLKALEKYGSDHKLIAKKLGIGYTTLWRKIKEIENGA
ncbi:MAG TPA: sigma-54 dependent transcriptional regulator [Smithellaceae bacterium]|nr:sigma-54 dependent transcriptional regulator [Smithellaceae bacterium]